MMLFATLAAACILPAPEFRDYGRSVAAAALGLSNMLFWSQSDYFDPTSDGFPLLHTWSLGVEEQFYVVLPLTLSAVFLWKTSARKSQATPLIRVLALLCMIWLASFLGSLIELDRSAKTAFFWLPPRAWELLTGSILAAWGVVGRAQWVRPGARQLASWIGLGLLVASMVLLDADDRFPGLNALWPCLGSALLILAGADTSVTATPEKSLATRVLESRVLVGIGLISYSLYLWHWPILSLAKFATTASGDVEFIAAEFVVIGIASYLSWRFVELPFRRSVRASRRTVLLAGLTAVTASGLAGVAIYVADGFPRRLPAEARTLAAGATDVSAHRGNCHMMANELKNFSELCRYGAPGTAPTLAVWGDSHAVELAAALGEQAARSGTSILHASGTECPAATDLKISTNRTCGRFNRMVLNGLTKSQIPVVLLISSAFKNRYYESALVNQFERGIAATVAELTRAGKKVVLLDPIPYVTWPVPRNLAFRRWWSLEAPKGPTPAEYAAATAPMRELYARLAQTDGVSVIEVSAALCASGRCKLEDDGWAMYYDAHHLSMHGARFLVSHSDALSQLVQQQPAPGR
jgi:peptidoglycan/LPS O-acetylase OafA/YrhL